MTETPPALNAGDRAEKKSGWLPVYHGCAVLLSSALCSVLQINRLSPEYLGADTVLYPVMSLQNVTLFVWGQNRFANILPALFYPLRSAPLNLAAHLFAFALAFYLFIWLTSLFCARWIFMSRKPLDVYILFSMLLATFFILLQPSALYVLADEAQPYCWSYFLFGSAALLVFYRGSLIAWAIGALILAFAYGFNPSVLLAAAVVTLAALVYQRGRTGLFFFALNAVVFILWSIVIHKYASSSPPYYGFDYLNTYVNMRKSLSELASVVRLPLLCLLAAIAAGISMFGLSTLRPRARFALAIAIAFALFWWGLFSDNAWVKANFMNFRYFFPVIFIGGTALAVILWNFVRQFQLHYQVSIAAICIVSVLGYLLRAPQSFDQYALFRAVNPYVVFARENGIRFVAGDYWVVWPTVFRLLDTPDQAFGVTYRGDGSGAGLRRALQSELAKSSKVSLICLRALASECTADAVNLTGRAWVPTSAGCGPGCTVLVTSR